MENNIKKKNIEITVIAPCYNEELNLSEFYTRIIKSIDEINVKNYELIFIDDGSKDKTWEIINELSNKNKSIIGIKLLKNFGHQNALLSGFKNASGKYILTIDCDLQDPPELLKNIYNKIRNKDINIVSCQRSTRKDNLFKKITSNIFYFLFNLLSYTKINKQVADFKIFDRKVLNFINSLNENDPFLRGLISWPGFKEEIELFDRPIRKHGVTGWSISKMFNFSMNAFFGFSNFPMRLSFIICFILSIIFIIFGAYAFISYLAGNIVRGWTSIFLVIILFNIFNFFILGLISEYTGRIYLEVKQRPRYLIEKILKK